MLQRASDLIHGTGAAVRGQLGQLTGHVIQGRDLSPELVEEMWRLWKTEFMLLGDEEQRRRHFFDTCSRLTTVGTVRDEHGELVSFWSATTGLRTSCPAVPSHPHSQSFSAATLSPVRLRRYA